jgi:unsaturated rhamnogalacturonyl hydrolase
MDTDRLETLVEAVARHTVERDMEGEDWEKAVAINGLHATGEPAFVEAARRLVDRCVATQTSAGQFSYGSLDYKQWLQQSELDSFTGISDPAALGQGVLDVYERTGEERYLDAARRQYEFLQDVDRTADGGISHRREAVELWVDSIYMLCPFLARYGVAADEPEAFDEAARQARVVTKHVQDPHTGLCRHIWRETPNTYPQGTFWARGNGWAIAGILDALERLPEDHPDREALVVTVRELAAAVVELQDASGFWHHILDDPESPLETSGTLMFAYAFAKGREMGILTDDRYEDASRRGLEVTLDLVTDDGGVERVARPPGGPDMPFGVTSYGQGWFLLAAAQFA